MRVMRKPVAAVVLVMLLGVRVWAADPVPPPKMDGGQWSLVVIPDPQAYTENYDSKLKGRGHMYEGRFDKQTEWIAASVKAWNIRSVVDLGDNVQNFARQPGEWALAMRAMDRLHVDGDPDKAAVVPYGVCIGNHDYDSSTKSDLKSTMFEKNLGPGWFRDAQGQVKEAIRAWFGGDDLGWEWAGPRGPVKGVGRNSWQWFEAGGRKYLHLTLETAVTDQGIAWAKEVLKAHGGWPTIVSTHAMIDGGKAAGWRLGARMGREVKGGPNPTNDAPMIMGKLLKDNDQIFLVLCGHMYLQGHRVEKNAKGNDVHILEQCYHLDYGGGRVCRRDAPRGGWPSGYDGPDDTTRNGSGWLTVFVFDEAKKTITRFTYSPLLGVWATDRKGDDRTTKDGQDGVWWNRSYPTGDDVIEGIPFDFTARFGPVK